MAQLPRGGAREGWPVSEGTPGDEDVVRIAQSLPNRGASYPARAIRLVNDFTSGGQEGLAVAVLTRQRC